MAVGKDSVQVTATLPRELAARLDAYAEEHRWSRSAAIAALITDHLPPADAGTASGTAARKPRRKGGTG